MGRRALRRLDARAAVASAPSRDGDRAGARSPLAARADTGAGDLAPEVHALVDAWLAAQNNGDFAAYEKLYADKFTGVRRSGARTVSLDRAGWMRDRERMFQKPMKVSASDLRSPPRRPRARVTFVQEFESPAATTIADRSSSWSCAKRAWRASRARRCSRSEKAGTSAATPAAAQFAFVVGKLRHPRSTAPSETWAIGAARLDDDGDPLVTSKRADPPAAGVRGARSARKLIVHVARRRRLHRDGARSCASSASSCRTSARGRSGATSKAARAKRRRGVGPERPDARRRARRLHAREPAFARAAERRIALVTAGEGDGAARRRDARRCASCRRGARCRRATPTSGGKGKWDASAADAEVDVERWELPGSRSSR